MFDFHKKNPIGRNELSEESQLSYHEMSWHVINC